MSKLADQINRYLEQNTSGPASPDIGARLLDDGTAADYMAPLDRASAYQEADKAIYADTAERDAVQLAQDGLLSAGSLVTQGLGGLLSLGVQQFPVAVPKKYEASLAVSEAAQKLSNFISSGKTDVSKAQAELKQQRAQIADQNIDLQEKQDMIRQQMGEDVSPTLNRLQNEFNAGIQGYVDSPGQFFDDSVGVIGSLLAGGGLGKGLSKGAEYTTKAGSQLLNKLTGTPVAGNIANRGANSAAANTAKVVNQGVVKDALSTAGGIGALETGSAYQQALQDNKDISINDLYAKSPKFLDLLESGMSEEDARTTLLNKQALDVAKGVAPLSVLAGSFSRPLFEAPLSMGGKNLLQKTLGEGVEEALQNTSQELMGNISEKVNLNRRKEIHEGLGRAAAEGFATGIGGAGIIQSPAIAGTALKSLAKESADRLKSAAAKREERIEQNSPTAPQNVDAVFEEATQAAESNVNESLATQETELQEAEAQATTSEDVAALQEEAEHVERTRQAKLQMIERARAAYRVNNAQLSEYYSASSEDVRSVLDSNEGKPISETLVQLSDVIEKSDDVDTIMDAAMSMTTVMSNYDTLLNSGLGRAVEENPELEPLFNSMVDVGARLGQNPKTVQALQKVAQILQESQQQPSENVGEAEYKESLARAEMAPETVDPNTIEQVLYASDEGTFTLTPEQKVSLNMARSIVLATQSVVADFAGSGVVSEDAAKVSNNVLVADGEKGKSLKDFFVDIRDQFKKNNLEGAQANAIELGNFAQAMQNKLQAINDYFDNGATGPFVEFQTYKNGSWFTSKSKVGVRPNNPTSLRVARQIHSEATMLGRAFNNIARTVPELGLKPIPLTSLNKSLLPKTVQEQKPVAESVAADPVMAQETFKTDEQAEDTSAFEYDPDQLSETPTVREEQTEQEDVSNKAAEEPAVVEKDAEQVIEEASVVEDESVIGEETNAEEATAVEETVAEEESDVDVLANLNNESEVAFSKVYKKPNANRSNLVGKSAPIEWLRSQIADPRLHKVFDDYSSYAQKMKEAFTKKLGEYLKKPAVIKARENGEDLGTFRNARLIGLMENTEDGSAKLNDALVDSAIMAGMGYLISDAGFNSPSLDIDDYARLFGIPAEELLAIPNFMQRMEGTIPASGLKGDMAQAIKKAWGVSAANENIPTGYSEGLAEGIAAEILDYLEKSTNILSVDRDFEFSLRGRLSRVRINVSPKTNYLDVALFDEINEAISPERIKPFYVGSGENIPVSNTQAKNDHVPLTAAQKTAQKNAQKNGYKVVPYMAGLYQNMTADVMVDLFSDSKATEDNSNVNALKAIGSKRYEYEGILATLKRYMEGIGDALDKTIHFKYEFINVNRMMQQGSYTPQSNKAIRSILTATQSVLDFKNPEHVRNFQVTIAQHFGIKVHKQSFDTSIKQLQEMYLEPIVDAITPVLGKLENNESLSSKDWVNIKDAYAEAGVGLSYETLHNGVEWARFVNANPDEPFTTSAQFEADGMTNGPIMAIHLLNSNQFSVLELENYARGGTYFGKTPFSANDFYSQNPDFADLYVANSTKVNGTIAQFLAGEDIPFNVQIASETFKKSMQVVSSLLGKVISVSPEGEVQFGRDGSKNPLTVTIYGSGTRGIASKLSGQVETKLYEQLSAAIRANQEQGVTLAQGFFGKGISVEDAKKQWAEFSDAFYETTGQRIPLNEEGFKTFTMRKAARVAMTDTYNSGYAQFLDNAIKETVGPAVLNNSRLLQVATDIQSAVRMALFNEELKKISESTEQFDRKLFTPAQINQAMQNVLKKVPMVSTGEQNFLIGASERAYQSEMFNASALSGNWATAASMMQPVRAGVRGAAYMNIGGGDGLAITRIYERGMQNILDVFDGVYVPVTEMQDKSREINEAVASVWDTNYLKNIHQSFVKSKDALLTAPLDKETLSSLNKSAKSLGIEKVRSIEELFDAIAARMENAAKNIDLKHAVMKKVAHSNDQMAGANSPSFNDGIDVGNPTDFESIRDTLNQMARSEAKGFELVKDVAKYIAGRTEGQFKGLVDSLLNNPKLAETKVLMVKGIDNLVAAAEQYGVPLTNINKRNFSGFTDIGSNSVVVVDGKAETLVHELVHIATFETIKEVYEGGGTNDSKNAVAQLEKLYERFMALKPQMVRENNEDYFSALQEIARHKSNSPTAKAIRLNEFMAWSLGSESLRKSLSKEKAGLIGKIGKRVRGLIEKLLGIKTPTNFLESVEFHTAALAQEQTIAEKFSSVALYQSNQYGTDNRLTELATDFGSAIASKLNGTVEALYVPEEAAVVSTLALENAKESGFAFTPQQESVFQLIHGAFYADAVTGGPALARAQQLLKEFVQRVDKKALGQEKLAFVTRGTGTSGRPAVLANFIAMAMVHPEVRAVLDTLKASKEETKAGTFDEKLGSFGQTVLDSLSNKLTKIKGDTLKEQADSLVKTMVQVNDRAGLSVMDAMDKGGDLLNSLNDKVVEKQNALAERLVKKSEATRSNKNAGRIKKLAAAVQSGVAALISERQGKAAAEGISALLNSTDIPQALREVLGDLIGRTDSNANVYDMIKGVKGLVQRLRQSFREELPKLIREKFTEEVTEAREIELSNVLGKSDIGVLVNNLTNPQIKQVLTNKSLRKNRLQNAEKALIKMYGSESKAILKNANNLAGYLVSGKSSGKLLRNAYAVGKLSIPNTQKVSAEQEKAIDTYVTLAALDMQMSEGLEAFIERQYDGIQYLVDYLAGQRKEDISRMDESVRLNVFKGYVPTQTNREVTIVIRPLKDSTALINQGYRQIGSLEGIAADSVKNTHAIFQLDTKVHVDFEQGIVQNAQNTILGVEEMTGVSVNQKAPVIWDKAIVAAITEAQLKGNAKANNYMPVFNATGKVVAYEYILPEAVSSLLNETIPLPTAIGIWRGRQVEESMADVFNQRLALRLHEMYQSDLRSKGALADREYVNIQNSDDPIIRDAVSLITPRVWQHLGKYFTDGVMVRKDMLEDVIGSRDATVGDFWTGRTRWSEETQKAVQQIAVSLLGNSAYQKLIKAENLLRAGIADLKTLIVVKSVVVPAVNIISNTYQALARGVTVKELLTGVPKKIAEIEYYVESQRQLTKLEADLVAATDKIVLQEKIRAEIDSIKAAQKGLTIWPLLAKGEFSSVADIANNNEDGLLAQGRIGEYVEALTNKLPEGVSTAAKYALITKDTALFKGLQKAVEYGDFIAKAIQYDHLTKKKGMSKEKALGRITEEYVNYDKIVGRNRRYLEDIGMLWFYNFKLRITKVALSMIRNNPLQTLLYSMAPKVNTFGSVGMPTDDNVFSKLFEGTLPYSIGPGQGVNAITLNPWYNLAK